MDETNLSPQFKMLRLESCLEGEAAETVKGLGYSEHAYEAAKARLNRKYGGNRRQVQAHFDELRKMRPINADNPRELEKFADIVERTVVSLKENKQISDLEGGTLYAIVLEKLPQPLLSQYYRSIKEKGKVESLDELRHWIAEEAEYQVQASEVKHGFSSAGNARGKGSRSYFRTAEEKCDRPGKVCKQKHSIWKCDLFKEMEHKKKWDKAKKLGLCYRCLGKGHLGESCVWSRECGENQTAAINPPDLSRTVQLTLEDLFNQARTGRMRAKRYLCLFLCLQTHCCHLETASSLDTDAFLNAFVRMTARRGWPQQMLSDNGTNF